tara:strand:+ start:3572 stop:4309 length:738 start_codon:yes stop_codon:yes gene_type:complete
MKKNLFYLLFIFFLNVQLADAQHALEEGIILRFGIASNIGNFGKVDHSAHTYSGYNTISHKGNGFGFSFDFGKQWAFHGLSLPDDMDIGLDVSFIEVNLAMSHHNSFYSTDESYYYDDEYYSESVDFNMYHLYFGPKVGPMFSYSLARSMSIDASFKAQLIFSGAFAAYDMQYDGYSYTENIRTIGLGLRFSPSVYYRYRKLIAGFEFNIGNTNIANSVTFSAIDGEGNEPLPLSNVKFILGLKL